jgi:acetyl-CoA carboxylase biotin carboxylase subunit
VYAEDPENNYFPSPGEITFYSEPSGPGVRVDGAAYTGWTVPIDYDPLLAKLTVWAHDRKTAIARMRRALAEYRVLGITTNLSFFDAIMADQEFIGGHLHTGFLDEFKQRSQRDRIDSDELVASVLAAASMQPEAKGSHTNGATPNESLWRAAGRQGLLR